MIGLSKERIMGKLHRELKRNRDQRYKNISRTRKEERRLNTDSVHLLPLRFKGYLYSSLKTHRGLLGAIKAIQENDKKFEDFTGLIPNGRVYSILEYVDLNSQLGYFVSSSDIFSKTTQELMRESSVIKKELKHPFNLTSTLKYNSQN